MKKIKLFLTSSLLMLGLVAAPLAAVSAAATYSPGGSLECGANGGAVGTTTGCAPTQAKTLPEIVAQVIDIFSWIVGAAAVIMIIYGGFKYVTSGGAEKGVKDAKSTLMYAVIGLVVVALSQVIVNFVLKTSSGLNT